MVSKCEVCGGVGTVKNEWFERCAQVYGESQRGQCKDCEWYHDCYQGEIVECEACNGSGKVLVSSDDDSTDEREWLNRMVNNYTNMLKRKYGDNFAFTVITLRNKIIGNGTITFSMDISYGTEQFKRAAENCKDLLARVFTLEKLYMKEVSKSSQQEEEDW